jgi:hypothetical protein
MWLTVEQFRRHQSMKIMYVAGRITTWESVRAGGRFGNRRRRLRPRNRRIGS